MIFLSLRGGESEKGKKKRKKEKKRKKFIDDVDAGNTKTKKSTCFITALG